MARSARATPPWYFSARTVATTTATSGRSPDLRHLMSTNFSAPRSAPKPASVTTKSASRRPARVATTELQPWAMLPNGPAVHERRSPFERLHQVGRQRVAQQGRHGALGAQLAHGDGLGRSGVADHDVADPPLQVRPRLGEAEDRHQLGGDDDVEPVLAGEPVRVASQGDGDLAQRAVVHVQHALPGDAPDVDVELVAVVHVVVDQRGQQVVRRRDRREVTGEVQVDLGHRDHLAVAAPGRTALHPEDRPHRRFTQAGDRAMSQAVQGVGEADGGGGLALARRRGGEGGHQHQPTEWPVCQRREVGQVDLGLVVAVGDQVLLLDPQGLGRHLPDRSQRGAVGDLDVRQHCRLPPSVSTAGQPYVGYCGQPSGLSSQSCCRP